MYQWRISGLSVLDPNGMSVLGPNTCLTFPEDFSLDTVRKPSLLSCTGQPWCLEACQVGTPCWSPPPTKNLQSSENSFVAQFSVISGQCFVSVSHLAKYDRKRQNVMQPALKRSFSFTRIFFLNFFCVLFLSNVK